MGRDAEEEGDSDDGFQFIGDATSESDDSVFQFGHTAENAQRGATEPELDLDAAEPSDCDGVVETPPEPRVGAVVAETTTRKPEPTTDTAQEGASEHHHGSAEDSGHDAHHPVVEDWPRGVGEASWWPFITAVGAAAIYVSVALWLLGRGRGSVIGAAVGPMAFIGALTLTVFGVYGWLYHAFVAHFWTRGTNRLTARSLRWGMLGFIASEIATFGALFAYYFYIRAGPWPPADAMAGGVDLLNVLVVANTVVLLLSSLTLHFGHHALAHGNRDRFVRLVGLTVGLGLVFLAGQAVEYHAFINREGFTWTSGVLGSAFFGLTGLHGAHVAFGALLLTITLVRGKHGQFDADRDLSVSLVSLYWHFVDAVWLVLVAVLYVGASVSP